MTLRQIALVLEGEADSRFQDYELAFYMAYHAGVFSQPYGKNRFPRYERLAPKRARRADNANPEIQKHNAMAMTIALGGEIRKKKD